MVSVRDVRSFGRTAPVSMSVAVCEDTERRKGYKWHGLCSVVSTTPCDPSQTCSLVVFTAQVHNEGVHDLYAHPSAVAASLPVYEDEMEGYQVGFECCVAPDCFALLPPDWLSYEYCSWGD